MHNANVDALCPRTGLRLAVLLGVAWSVIGGIFWRVYGFGPNVSKPPFALWDLSLALCGAFFGLSLVLGTFGIRRYVPEYLRSVSLIAMVYFMAYFISEMLFHGFFA